jgi:hypothetical protein
MSGPAPSLEADARRMAETLEKRRWLVLLLLTLIYAAGAIAHARAKPLWYDEIITVMAAGAPDLATTWKAAQATDINPPLPHLLIHLSLAWVRQVELGARIPAIVGFWVFCLCLYYFVHRRLGILYALAALLLPVATGAYAYSVEARAYGPELAFTGLALIAWQAAADGRHRSIALPGLALSLAGATLCHYYAILLYLPLGGAEAFRWYRTRRIDFGVGLALAGGLGALGWRATTIAAGASKWSKHSWAPPSPEQVMEFWETGLQHSLTLAVLLLALVALAVIAGWRDSPAQSPVELPAHEWMAGVLFLAIPVAAVAGAMLVTHMFTPRYALIALAGVGFLFPMVAAHLAGGRPLFGFLIFVSLLTGLGLVTISMPGGQDPYRQEPELQKALAEGPVVIPDGQLFLLMWQYAPPALRPRLHFVADGEAAIRYMGFDTIDEGLRVLRPWAPVQVVDARDFLTPGREFVLYQNTLRPAWLLSKIVDDGGSAQVLAHAGFRELVKVRVK